MLPLSSSSVLSFDADGESPMVEDIDKDPGMHTPKLSSFINHATPGLSRTHIAASLHARL
jgi:hypothetical protein